ncbi:hypothetical protein Tco_0800728 [Tanacetum coccineum]|uniref:Uncharacterized protein n=1 Tax=Tanacetum coccineum TaxID=301880 RepID=A0ABQ4ZXR6_9ASTR
MPLTGFHFAMTVLVGFISNSSEYMASKHVPLWELLWFSIVANVSITRMNLSLYAQLSWILSAEVLAINNFYSYLNETNNLGMNVVFVYRRHGQMASLLSCNRPNPPEAQWPLFVSLGTEQITDTEFIAIDHGCLPCMGGMATATALFYGIYNIDLPEKGWIVGYTNDGKSRLLEQLPMANILAEDRLFAFQELQRFVQYRQHQSGKNVDLQDFRISFLLELVLFRSVHGEDHINPSKLAHHEISSAPGRWVGVFVVDVELGRKQHQTYHPFGEMAKCLESGEGLRWDGDACGNIGRKRGPVEAEAQREWTECAVLTMEGTKSDVKWRRLDER